MKKTFGIFDTRPLIWFHYVLLTGVIIGFFGMFFGMKMTFHNSVLLYLTISISDQIIHKILGVD